MSPKQVQFLTLVLAASICGAMLGMCSGCQRVQYVDGPQAMQSKQQAKPATPNPSPAPQVDLPNDQGLTSEVGKALSGQQEAARKYEALYLAMVEACDGNQCGWKQRSDMDLDFKQAMKLRGLKPGELADFKKLVDTHLAPVTGPNNAGDVDKSWLADCKTRFGQLAFACREAAK